MMIPKDIEKWFIGGPWSPPNVDFHSYWSQPQNQENPDLYIRFGNGSHELAHMIQCQDQYLLDPHWGFPKILDPYDPQVPIEEAEVHLIEVVILHHVENWKNMYSYTLQKDLIINSAISFLGQRPGLTTKIITETVHKAYRKWSLEHIWQETQRKYKILSTIL